MDRDVENLSGGELQRFAMAVVAAQEADVYMIDEPSSYLDVRQRLKAAQVGEMHMLRYLLTAQGASSASAESTGAAGTVTSIECCQIAKPSSGRALHQHASCTVGQVAQCILCMTESHIQELSQSCPLRGWVSYAGHPWPADGQKLCHRGGARPVGAGLPFGFHLLFVRQARRLRRRDNAVQRARRHQHLSGRLRAD